MSEEKIYPFHVAVPVYDLNETLHFYQHVLNCSLGRRSDKWVDLNFFGHQFVLHLSEQKTNQEIRNAVDGKEVPVPHYGVVLPWQTWHDLAEDLKNKNVVFQIEPYIRFKGEVGEQATMFFYDPSGNALEFKSFKNIENLFAY